MSKPSTSLLKRRLDIAELVRENGEIKVDELAERLSVSGVTIRNDLNYLEQQGFLKRSFGGAIYTARQVQGESSIQLEDNFSDKILDAEIVNQVAAQLSETGPLFIGAGKLLKKVIPCLAAKPPQTVIFHDLSQVALAKEYLSSEIIVTGGVLGTESLVLTGERAIGTVLSYPSLHSLIFVDAIGDRGELYVGDKDLAQLYAATLTHSKTVTAVIISRQIFGNNRYEIGNLRAIACVISSQIVAAEHFSYFREAGMSNLYTNNDCLTWINTMV